MECVKVKEVTAGLVWSDFKWFKYVAGTFTELFTSNIRSLKYTGSDSLAYYSVKADADKAGFSVWTYMGGGTVSPMDVDNDNSSTTSDTPKFAISYLTFWKLESAPVPEPASFVVWSLLGLAAVSISRRRNYSDRTGIPLD